VLFLDEASSAAPSVQAAAYQLVLDRRLGEARMKPGWRLALAGNRVSDGSVAFRLAMPLANRMLHIEQAQPDLEDWTRWALTQGKIDPLVIGFLRFRPNLLSTFDEALKARKSAFATPRSWEMVSRLLMAAPQAKRDALHELVAGAVGDGEATEFMAWLKLKNELPDLDALLAGQSTPPLAKGQLDKGYACAVALAGRVIAAAQATDLAKAQAASQIGISWLEEADTRFTALFINLVRAQKPMLLLGKAHSAWIDKHRSLLLE
jgi:hypothetical protein